MGIVLQLENSVSDITLSAEVKKIHIREKIFKYDDPYISFPMATLTLPCRIFFMT